MHLRRGLMVVVLAGSVLALPGPGGADAEAGPEGCTRPPGADRAHLSEISRGTTPLDSPAYAAWLDSELAQRAKNTVLDLKGAWSDTLIGMYSDHVARQWVIVVDDITRAAEIRDVVDEVSGPHLSVRVEVGCADAAELTEAMEYLASRTWAKSSTINWSARVDPTVSRVQVSIEADATPERSTIAAALGALVQFADAAPATHGRLDDGSPHYGGALIDLTKGGSGDCTSGFAMDKNGGRWMVTAAHCSSSYTSNQSYYSGYKYYGVGLASQNFGPTRDVMLIGSGTEQYARILHVDPCCPSTRTVTSKGDPRQGDFVCMSGHVSRAVCGIEIYEEDFIGCMDGYCYQGEAAAGWKGSTVFNRPGDSGAPVYERVGSSSAKILGLNVGADGGANTTTVFIKTSKVEAWTGATVATTCCTGPSW